MGPFWGVVVHENTFDKFKFRSDLNCFGPPKLKAQLRQCLSFVLICFMTTLKFFNFGQCRCAISDIFRSFKDDDQIKFCRKLPSSHSDEQQKTKSSTTTIFTGLKILPIAENILFRF